MRFDWWTFALQTVNFAILVWLLQRFLYKPLLARIDARRAAFDSERAEIRTGEEEVKTALAALQADREDIAKERAETLRAAAARAEEEAAARHAEARREASALLDETRATLAQERDRAQMETRRAALDLGGEIARRLLAEVPAEMLVEAWLLRIEAHLGTLPAAERDELASELSGGAALRVVTAVSLGEAATVEWRARLHSALGDRITITFETDDALIAGAELHFPYAVLRFSWRSTLARMRAEIENHDDARR
jgi:F-type H+-transporting ATPase subunit b